MPIDRYTIRFPVARPPAVVFAAINNVRGWWSAGIEGTTDIAGGRFVHQVQDLHRCEIEVTELEADRRVVWTVIDNHFGFTKDKTEWTGTTIRFDILPLEGGSELIFAHIGLVPDYECYDVCTSGWTNYMASLKSLIETGRGDPNIGAPKTDSERLVEKLTRN